MPQSKKYISDHPPAFLLLHPDAARQEALRKINNTSYGPDGEGYIFVFQYDGLYLNHRPPTISA